MPEFCCRSLVRHSQVHMDPKLRPKPYKCEFCKKEYTEVTGYKHHMRSVHTGKLSETVVVFLLGLKLVQISLVKLGNTTIHVLHFFLIFLHNS